VQQIYVLTEPRTGVPRYVGRSSNAQQRFLSHVGHACWPRSSAKSRDDQLNWMRAHILRQELPQMTIVAEASDEQAHNVESRWIKMLEWFGCPLINKTTTTFTSDGRKMLPDEPLTESMQRAAYYERLGYNRRGIAHRAEVSEASITRWRGIQRYRDAACLDDPTWPLT